MLPLLPPEPACPRLPPADAAGAPPLPGEGPARSGGPAAAAQAPSAATATLAQVAAQALAYVFPSSPHTGAPSGQAQASPPRMTSAAPSFWMPAWVGPQPAATRPSNAKNRSAVRWRGGIEAL